MRSHVNIEICSTVLAYKYLYKYVRKGPDMAVVALEKDADAGERPVNEIKQYATGRYLSAFEAYWRFFGFDLHDESPRVEPLAVHLPNRQVSFLSCA